MTKFTEGRHATEGLMSEANFHRSRGNAKIAEGTPAFDPGTILGKYDVGGKTAAGSAGTPAPAGATITASPTAATFAKVGVHRLVCIVGGSGNAAKWRHFDPDGNVVGIATSTVEYTGGGLTFTIADPGTDPVAGDEFIVTVSGDHDYRYAPSPDAQVADFEGAEIACAIALYGVKAPIGETEIDEDTEIAIIERDAEWNGHKLSFAASVNNAAKRAVKIAQIAGAGIIARF